MTRTDRERGTTAAPVRGVLLVAGALAVAAVVVALVGGPRARPDDGSATAPNLVDADAITGWCQRQPTGGRAASIGGSWECAWVQNGFFRHAPVGDAPCQERFGPESKAAAVPGGVRCSTP